MGKERGGVQESSPVKEIMVSLHPKKDHFESLEHRKMSCKDQSQNHWLTDDDITDSHISLNDINITPRPLLLPLSDPDVPSYLDQEVVKKELRQII